MIDAAKVILLRLKKYLKLQDDFSGELHINYHKGMPSKKIKKVEVVELASADFGAQAPVLSHTKKTDHQYGTGNWDGIKLKVR